jgi:NAD(P)-dependent dehydrogenase (short-subunit alcohol dehydrogenase family)
VCLFDPEVLFNGGKNFRILRQCESKSMSNKLTNKTIIVTGGGSGIGQTACLHFAADGANVVIADRDVSAGNETHRMIADKGGVSLFIKADVTIEEEVAALVEHSVARFGALNGAFNNAGVAQSHKLLHEVETAEWNKVIAVDLTGVFWCMKYEIKAMLATGGGSIVNTSSAVGVVGLALCSDYAAAKHGVIGLTKAAAVDYATAGIRVNAVLPGLTRTPIVDAALQDPAFAEKFAGLTSRIPMGGMADPTDIAEGARWLLSDAAKYITGVSLPIDGGYIAV